MKFFKALFGSKEEKPEEKKKAEEAKNFDVLKYDGVRALRAGQAEFAIRCFTHALQMQDDLEIHDYLSQAYIRTGNLRWPTNSCRNWPRHNLTISRYLSAWPTWHI